MTVKVDLSPLIRLRDSLVNANASVRRFIMKQWAAIYRGYAQERYDRFSKGGGNWRPLSAKTIESRRKGKGSGPVATILRDTSTLHNALDPGQLSAGAIEENTDFGVRVGYGGGDRHPVGLQSATIANIAMWHDQGMGRNPKRQIIANPDDKTLKRMAKAVEDGVPRVRS